MVSSEMAESSPSPQNDAPPPSPQCVGREFVRQYYTLLAEAPQFVHRFYSNESIFVHGSDEEIIGQKAIEQKISALGFHDCRTRIRVLDSHQTIGKGVVVQVVGEITVNGDLSAMRRFVQTFVLVPQSEKKYYVYNDIFRYEDDLFKEEDGKDGENDSGTVPDPPTARPLEQRPQRGMSNGGTHTAEDLESLYSMLPGSQPSMVNEQGIQNQIPPSTQPHTYAAPMPQRTAPAPEAPPTVHGAHESAGGTWSSSSAQLPQSTSSVAFGQTGTSADAQQQYAQPSQQQTTAAPVNPAMPSQSPVPFNVPQVPATAPPITDQSRPQSDGKESPSPADEQDQQQSRDSNAGKTYASLLKAKPSKGPQAPSNTAASGPSPPMVSPGQNVQPRAPLLETPMPLGQPPAQRWNGPPPLSNFGPNPNMQPPGPWDNQPQQQQQFSKQYRSSYPADFPPGVQSQDARVSPAPSGGDGGGRGGSRDKEGVFLRNVPFTANDFALRNFIAEAGYNIKGLRMVKKDGIAFAFAYMDQSEADRLLQLKVLKFEGATIVIQPLKNDMGRSAPGSGPGQGPGGFQYGGGGGMVRGGRNGRGNMAQRGGERGRGGRGGGPGPGIRTFSAGGGNRGGGGPFPNN